MSLFALTEQCGNAAYGVCQAYTADANKSPCGKAFNGIAKCSKTEFQKFYSGKLGNKHLPADRVWEARFVRGLCCWCVALARTEAP